LIYDFLQKDKLHVGDSSVGAQTISPVIIFKKTPPFDVRVTLGLNLILAVPRVKHVPASPATFDDCSRLGIAHHRGLLCWRQNCGRERCSLDAALAVNLAKDTLVKNVVGC